MLPQMSEKTIARFWEKVEPEPNSGCWLWTAATTVGGYGAFNLGRGWGVEKAHRVSWMLLRGEIPQGLVLDHLCRVTCCVNPAHLRPVTTVENFLAPGSQSPIKLGPEKTCCKKGHPFDDKNTYWRKDIGKGRRICKACTRERARKYPHRRARVKPTPDQDTAVGDGDGGSVPNVDGVNDDLP